MTNYVKNPKRTVCCERVRLGSRFKIGGQKKPKEVTCIYPFWHYLLSEHILLVNGT